MKHISKKSGFTLIELLVVIVILGILSTISVGTFRSYFAKARDSERVSAVQNIAMMMKVDSGGAGDCGVYNYLGGKTVKDGDTDCPDIKIGDLGTLLTDNDYSMPDEKNGLVYYYGYRVGTTEGDNDFFIVVGAEEDDPQNGKLLDGAVVGTSSYDHGFVDGTTDGITVATTTCTISETGVPTCGDDWEVNAISGCSAMNCSLCKNTGDCTDASCSWGIDDVCF